MEKNDSEALALNEAEDSLPEVSGDLEQLLAYLKATRGFDFTAYKRTTLSRRVQKRMQTHGLVSYDEYQDFLEVHPDEFQELFNTILINVTSFFRDEESWAYLAAEVIPKVIEKKNGSKHIRAWVAGCASGEEAYTLAMLLAEALGVEGFRERVKIYATDLDDDALNRARLASYSSKDVKTVPEALLKKYFDKVQEPYVFDRDLRRSIIFGKHDLIQDAPISRVDLLLCRNTLMYFNAEAKDRMLARFHFALNDDGFMFLGKAETLLNHHGSFLPVDPKRNVFARVPGSRTRERLPLLSPGNGNGNGHADGKAAGNAIQTASNMLRASAFDSGPVAQVVLDLKNQLAFANEKARATFSLSSRDLGKVLEDLEFSFRPVELRSGIDQVYEYRKPVSYKDVRWSPQNRESLMLNVKITPLFGGIGELLGMTVTFEDMTGVKRLQEDLQNFNQELETAYEEVQSTNEELQTTNEELQSTIEELETTNEELQSTNEELETMNEELQSSNEELETMNEELRTRGVDLNEAYAFLQSVMSSLSESVIVVDRTLQILSWNSKSEDMWGLRADEVDGKHLLNLDIGLPTDKLRAPVKACLNGSKCEELTLDGMNRRGKTVHCRVLCTPLDGTGAEPRGVIVLVEEIEKP